MYDHRILINSSPFETPMPKTNAYNYNAYNRQNLSKNILAGTISFEGKNNYVSEFRVSPDYLSILLEEVKRNQEIELSYIQKGISWVPNYNIILNENKTGTLRLDASIINEIEDLNNVKVNFAVGLPYFPYADKNSPIVDNINSATANINTNNRSLGYSNVVVSAIGIQKDNNNNKTSLNSKSFEKEDFFYYEREKFSIQKNEKLKLNISKFNFSYKDIYFTDLKTNKDVFSWRNSAKRKEFSVIHLIRFENNSNQPLTSGIALIRKKNKNSPEQVTQSNIDFTLHKDTVEIDIAISPNIIIEEISEKISTEKIDGKNVTTVVNKIKIENHKKKDVNIELEKILYGKLIKSDIKWEYKVLPTYYTDSNAIYNNDMNAVKWKFNVKAESKIEIIYTYSYKT